MKFTLEVDEPVFEMDDTVFARIKNKLVLGDIVSIDVNITQHPYTDKERDFCWLYTLKVGDYKYAEIPEHRVYHYSDIMSEIRENSIFYVAEKYQLDSKDLMRLINTYKVSFA